MIHGLIDICSIPALLFGLNFARRHVAALAAWSVVFGSFAVYKASALLALAKHEIEHPPLWDFKVFWMIGQICAAGHNIYDVASYEPFRAILNPSGDIEFNTIALKIGMPYPPPAALLFYPLGHVASLQIAMAAWYAVIALLLVLSIVALWLQFFRDQGAAGLIVVGVLVLTLPGTIMTVGFGQLNFLALLLLLIIWRRRTNWLTAISYAALLMIRPLTLLLAIDLIVRRRWKALAATLGASALLVLTSLPVVHVDGMVSYLHQNPAQRYPQIYFQGFDSLYKILVTLTHEQGGFFSLGAHPFVVILSAMLVGAAVYVCSCTPQAASNVCLSMLLTLGLFLYPNSSLHYSVLLLVPLLSLWHERAKLGLGDSPLIAFFTLNYGLFIWHHGSLTTGVAFAFDAAVFALIALRLAQREKHPELTIKTTARPFAVAGRRRLTGS